MPQIRRNRSGWKARRRTIGAQAAQHAQELMALAVEAAQSRHLPDFLQQFAERSAHMLKALWAGVAVFRGRETELHLSKLGDADEFPGRTSWFVARARDQRRELEIVPAGADAALLGGSVAGAAVFVPITASDAEHLGTMCLL